MSHQSKKILKLIPFLFGTSSIYGAAIPHSAIESYAIGEFSAIATTVETSQLEERLMFQEPGADERQPSLDPGEGDVGRRNSEEEEARRREQREEEWQQEEQAYTLGTVEYYQFKARVSQEKATWYAAGTYDHNYQLSRVVYWLRLANDVGDRLKVEAAEARRREQREEEWQQEEQAYTLGTVEYYQFKA